MRRLKIAGLAVMAALSLFVVVTASASAAVLPEFTVETNGTGSGGETEFISGSAAFKCRSATSIMRDVNKREGVVTADFSQCSATVLGEKLFCASLGDPFAKNGSEITNSTILRGGTAHLVRGPKGSPIALVLLQGPELHIECSNAKSTIVVLALLKGTLLGGVTPLRTKTKTFELKVETTKAGGTEQKFKDYENDSGTEVAAKVESSINGGAFEAEGVNAEPAKGTAERETEIIES